MKNVEEWLSEDEYIVPGRQSIAFFCNPNQHTEISCIPTCLDWGKKPSKRGGKHAARKAAKKAVPKYPSVTTEEYIVGRLQATYE